MSIAATATSLDAFPTAPAWTLMVRVRLVHAAFSSGPTPPAMTAPRPLSRPPQLLQISIVGAPGEPGARRAGKPAGTTVGYTPSGPGPAPRRRVRWPIDRPTNAGGTRSSGMDRTSIDRKRTRLN